MPTSSLLAVFAFSFGVSFGAVVSPGPVTAAVVSAAPRYGWRAGPLVTGGHALLEAAMLTLIGLGIASGLASPSVLSAVALGGGALLLFMGGGYVLAAARGLARLPVAEAGSAARPAAALLSLGALATISNPFWYAWWVTVAAGYLAQARALGLVAVGSFYLGHISADALWNTALGAATSAGSRWLTDGRYRALIGLTGVFMAYMGVVFIRSGWPA